MRKRTILNLADNVFWLIVALLPLILYLVQFCAYDLTSVTTFDSFASFMSGFGINTDSIVYTSMSDLFGTSGILPMFDSTSASAPLMYLSYFVMVQIVHLAVDFLVFIPKLCHKWMDKFTCTEGC